MAKGLTHEDIGDEAKVPLGSDRSFGLVFAAVFAIAGLWPLLDGNEARIWALGVSCAFAAAAFVAPGVLRPLNRLWFRFGMLLHHVVTPLVMGLLFFLTVTPVGLLMRATGKDPMRLRRDPGATTYWIARVPPGPAPQSMKNQF